MKVMLKFNSLVLAGSLMFPFCHCSGEPSLGINKVVADMQLPSEALPISAVYDWQRAPSIVQYSPSGKILPSWWRGARPEWCYRILSWHTVYEAEGNRALNSRVQLTRLRIYILSNSNRKWTLIDNHINPPTDTWEYPFNRTKSSKEARREEGGGVSVKPSYPFFHHGYGNAVNLSDPEDVRAVYVAIDFRLIRDDPAGPDDMLHARYVINSGADYYPGRGRSWEESFAPGIGSGRYLLATKEWRTATIVVPNKDLGAGFDEILLNPPPLSLHSYFPPLS